MHQFQNGVKAPSPVIEEKTLGDEVQQPEGELDLVHHVQEVEREREKAVQEVGTHHEQVNGDFRLLDKGP